MIEGTTIADRDIGNIARSERNNWIEEIESQIIDLAHYPTSYDVNCTQPVNFTECSYTEVLGGVYLKSQNLEINTRVMHKASLNYEDEKHLSMLFDTIGDKYVLDSLDVDEYPDDVVFPPGDNLNDLVDPEILARLMFDDEYAFIKPHPMMSDEAYRELQCTYGATRIIERNVSGMEVLKNAKTAYITAASELGIVAALWQKSIVNVGRFTKESDTVYFPINRVLLGTKNKGDRQARLNNMIACKSSGLLFPWMDDIEERTEAFYTNITNLRELHKPMAQATTR